mmetsp:Transcript_13204/g.34401  ORF Transcript_13204/g.34401 Transcript_13204/m.34401 type:complete len:213 (-) Transcript_13204:30-668(-)
MTDTNRLALNQERMQLALEEAARALDANEVPVGCVVIRDCDGVVVARGHNNTVATGNATRHAEFEAIDHALSDAAPGQAPSEVFIGCTLYVTCEPCIMCAAALRFVGLTQVCFGCYNEKFGGCGSTLDVHSDGDSSASLKIEPGVRAEEAVALFRKFYARDNSNAPLPQKRTRRQVELGGEVVSESDSMPTAPLSQPRLEGRPVPDDQRILT